MWEKNEDTLKYEDSTDISDCPLLKVIAKNKTHPSVRIIKNILKILSIFSFHLMINQILYWKRNDDFEEL